MKYFHGAKKKKGYFEGWYIKHQKGDEVISFIPSYHVDEEGVESTMLQIVTKDETYHIPYEIQSLQVKEGRFCCHIGGNVFSENGCIVDIEEPQIQIKGRIKYGKFLPPKNSIMGPFALFSNMECNHGVVSISHFLRGHLEINGKKIDFTDGVGYIETDWGTSFPTEYLWTQCSWSDRGPASLMLAVAEVPFAKRSFEGIVGVVYYQGEEYRLATYRGAKVKKKDGLIAVYQGRYKLLVKMKMDDGSVLKAPRGGAMSREVQESLSTKVQYRFYKDGVLLFNMKNPYGSVEWQKSL